MHSVRVKGAVPYRDVHRLGDIPEHVMHRLARELVLLKLRAREDVGGHDFVNAWAAAVGGVGNAKPEGLDDVVRGHTSWSAKTIGAPKPLVSKARPRIIVGRCSPVYSQGTRGGRDESPDKVGSDALEIYRERIEIVRALHGDIRMVVCMRNFSHMEFTVLETEIPAVRAAEYRWKPNENGNLQGYHRETSVHTWTWQWHGAQLTLVLPPMPAYALRFRIEGCPDFRSMFDDGTLLEAARWSTEWVKVVSPGGGKEQGEIL